MYCNDNTVGSLRTVVMSCGGRSDKVVRVLMGGGHGVVVGVIVVVAVLVLVVA